ncbi:hypothetical protein [Miniphocaeibacter halophilus]|uniref:Uncharacterized protein n=1 Tax=Miniphocaeibacter halophilus TaxID=2931922 RepID=A0AC61MRQ1_9FIRM|nr:hypothetical protein [Miniphocaeibacter halophilus]QQK08230.1 hypothetical protein JFY71_01445 [Miniphocaeibacter halophilus]
MKKFRNKIILILLLSFTLTSCNKEENITSGKLIMEESDYSYLQEYYNLDLEERTTLDVKEINKTFETIFGEEAIKIEGNYSPDKLIEASIKNAQYDELALTYNKDKIKEKLKNDYKIDVNSSKENYLVCAMDLGIVNNEVVKKIYKENKLSTDNFAYIITRVLNSTGVGRNYIGSIYDTDIGAKINNTWESFLLFSDEKLEEVGYKAVKNGTVTGYNLKSSENNSNFIKDKTIVYGHSDIKHAHQLVGLLRSEGIQARIQLEPKISVYKYLLEWGPVPEATPTYEVVQDGEDYFVHAVEYDLAIEFLSNEEMEKFNNIIGKYAKKNEGNEEGKGLLYESWWQPLYSTTNGKMNKEEYVEIVDNIVKNGIYEIHSFSTVENKEKVKAELTENNDFEIEQRTIYCNKAFYSYLIGEDYQ